MKQTQEQINNEARLILENLTPGGSEFHNDPLRCAKYLTDLKEKYFIAMVENAKLRKQLAEVHYDNETQP